MKVLAKRALNEYSIETTDNRDIGVQAQSHRRRLNSSKANSMKVKYSLAAPSRQWVKFLYDIISPSFVFTALWAKWALDGYYYCMSNGCTKCKQKNNCMPFSRSWDVASVVRVHHTLLKHLLCSLTNLGLKGPFTEIHYCHLLFFWIFIYDSKTIFDRILIVIDTISQVDRIVCLCD